MTDAIDLLPDDQARQAVKLLFDFMPESTFEGGRKPSAERIRTVTGALRDQAPFNDRPVIEGLLLAERPEQAAPRPRSRASCCARRTILQRWHLAWPGRSKSHRALRWRSTR
jgi:hypothetical protein